MSKSTIPDDDLNRKSVTVDVDAPGTLHLGIVGDTYTVLLGGGETAGKYCVIDMHVPPGGGPPMHRHDFEESFVMLDGEIEVTFRGNKSTVAAGQTVHVPADAPHQFKNVSKKPARLLCICAPAGQEDFFAQVGDKVAGRTTPPPKLDKAEQEKRAELAQRLSPKYKTELLGP